VIPARARWPVSSLTCPAGNCGVRSSRFKPKGPRSFRGLRVRRRAGGRTRVNPRVMPRHVEGPGEGKQGRAEVRDVPLGCGRCRPLIGKRSGEHHRPRGIEGAHSVRVLRMWNVETPSGSSLVAGRPTVRKAQSPAGNRMTREANAGAERRREGRHQEAAASWPWWRRTGRIRAVCSAREGAHAGQVSS
jgi:hypothetical protein